MNIIPEKGLDLGHDSLVDGMLKDGLWDVYNDVGMGVCAELCAEHHSVTREQQVEVSGGRGRPSTIVDKDEGLGKVNSPIIPHLMPAKLRKLRPSFKETGGTVTAGNASSISDGAASSCLVSGEKALTLGLEVIGKITGYADAAQGPRIFYNCTSSCNSQSNFKCWFKRVSSYYYEINEAFAEKVNVHGGAVYLGHPLGCSGARILVTLLGVLKQKNGKYGVWWCLQRRRSESLSSRPRAGQINIITSRLYARLLPADDLAVAVGASSVKTRNNCCKGNEKAPKAFVSAPTSISSNSNSMTLSLYYWGEARHLPQATEGRRYYVIVNKGFKLLIDNKDFKTQFMRNLKERELNIYVETDVQMTEIAEVAEVNEGGEVGEENEESELRESDYEGSEGNNENRDSNESSDEEEDDVVDNEGDLDEAKDSDNGEGMVLVILAKRAALKLLRVALNFNILDWDYADEIRKTTPGSTVIVGTEQTDGDERECRETWEWFLIVLKHDLNIARQDQFTFMSDKQKGLMQAFDELDDNVQTLPVVNEPNEGRMRKRKKDHPTALRRSNRLQSGIEPQHPNILPPAQLDNEEDATPEGGITQEEIPPPVVAPQRYKTGPFMFQQLAMSNAYLTLQPRVQIRAPPPMINHQGCQYFLHK
ncbi:UNVERIFIED_CONTAM: Acetyl-CoA acetyltransferase, cytosolic 1 [Sesamum calycinum]|uniref:Acetyl-CoA acetyltransferase, cytosolic 1 n=1 Tax=Sesamum calycinum TaxID=2727403 RepID=A0AAW2Q2W9_9LAMI